MAKSGRARRRMTVAGRTAQRDRELLLAARQTVARPPRPDGERTEEWVLDEFGDLAAARAGIDRGAQDLPAPASSSR